MTIAKHSFEYKLPPSLQGVDEIDRTMKHFFALFLLLVSFGAHATDPKYPVSAIPPSLKEDVNVVFRHDESSFRIISRSRAVEYVHKVVTILNSKGKDYATEIVLYDRLSKVRDISGTVFDAEGNQIKKLRNKEISDQSAYDGITLFSDARYKSLDLMQSVYPYTVEIEYEVEYNYLFYIPPFYVTSDEKISVEHSAYTLEFPAELSPRYKTRNIAKDPIRSKTKDGLLSLRWEFNNIRPIRFEPHGPHEDELLMSISAAPSSFEHSGYAGTMNSWNEFGRWISLLGSGRDALPDVTQSKLKQLTASASGTEEKVKILYEYLQGKTRYVGIQLGIGGFQPFEASVVDEKGYGDCKALSFYMVAMLRSINIPSHYALISAGRGVPELDAAFPSSQFNHAIVAVPNGRDTLWLECTSQTNPFGYQGWGTGNRKALLITESGAKIVNTTRYSESENLQIRSANVTLTNSGDATASVKTTYTGLQYENDDLYIALTAGTDEQKKWVLKNCGVPNFKLLSFKMTQQKERLPAAVVYAQLELNRFGTLNGKRIFITPNLMNRSTYIPEAVPSRKTDVVISFAYTDVDTIQYEIPEGYYPEYLPEPVSITSSFGDYTASFKVDDGKLVYYRKLIRRKGRFSPDSYQQLIEFDKAIKKADHTKVVLLNKT